MLLWFSLTIIATGWNKSEWIVRNKTLRQMAGQGLKDVCRCVKQKTIQLLKYHIYQF